MQRAQRGTTSVKTVAPDRVAFSYEGLDGIVRQTMLHFEPWPTRLEAHRAIYEMALEPDERRSILITIACEEPEAGRPIGSDECQTSSRPTGTPAGPCAPRRRGDRQGRDLEPPVQRGHRPLASDMYMLVTPTEHGLYPYAGIPWYSTVFGRDGIITAMMLLWADPSIAKGRAALPGGHAGHRHRSRRGCPARQDPARASLGRDGAPRRGAVPALLRHRRCNAALRHAGGPILRAHRRPRDHRGNLAEYRSGPALVRRVRRSRRRWLCRVSPRDGQGLANQGWKDSHDSIFHADGSGGRRSDRALRGAGLCLRGQAGGRAACAIASIEQDLSDQACQGSRATFGRRFEAAFWCEEIGTYALALDGAKRPCRVRTSNAGPCPVCRHRCAGARPPGCERP